MINLIPAKLIIHLITKCLEGRVSIKVDYQMIMSILKMRINKTMIIHNLKRKIVTRDSQDKKQTTIMALNKIKNARQTISSWSIMIWQILKETVS